MIINSRKFLLYKNSKGFFSASSCLKKIVHSHFAMDDAFMFSAHDTISCYKSVTSDFLFFVAIRNSPIRSLSFIS